MNQIHPSLFTRRLLLNVLESGDQQEILSFFTPYSQLESIRDFLIGLTLGYFLRYIMLLVCLVEGSARARYDATIRILLSFHFF